MAYLVIASPVQYIARFLGKGENTIFIEDAFDFGMEYVWTAIAIYLALLMLSCGAAYITGFSRRIRAVEQKERDDAASARYEERKARLEAEGRGECFIPLESDADAHYDAEYTVNLSTLSPLAKNPLCKNSPSELTDSGSPKSDTQQCNG